MVLVVFRRIPAIGMPVIVAGGTLDEPMKNKNKRSLLMALMI